MNAINEKEKAGSRATRRIDGKLVRILAGLLTTLLVTLGILYGIACLHRTRGKAFLRDFSNLKLGESTLADAQRLATKYRATQRFVAPDDIPCTFHRCEFTFEFENAPLNHIPFVHHIEFFGAILIEDGIVVGRQIEYERNTRSESCFRYLVIEGLRWPYNGTWRVDVDPKGLPHVVHVNLNPNSSEALRKRAYSLDLSCLAKLYGCNAPSAIYPPGTPYWGSPIGGKVSDDQ